MSHVQRLYDANLPHRSPRHTELNARYEVWYAANDFLAGVLFVVGSILFFFESGLFIGTWLFLIGSILFTLRPTIRLIRNIHLLRVPHDHTDAVG